MHEKTAGLFPESGQRPHRRGEADDVGHRGENRAPRKGETDET